MTLKEFVVTHPSLFVDYIMMEKALLDKVWKLRAIFVQKVKKNYK